MRLRFDTVLCDQQVSYTLSLRKGRLIESIGVERVYRGVGEGQMVLLWPVRLNTGVTSVSST